MLGYLCWHILGCLTTEPLPSLDCVQLAGIESLSLKKRKVASGQRSSSSGAGDEIYAQSSRMNEVTGLRYHKDIQFC